MNKELMYEMVCDMVEFFPKEKIQLVKAVDPKSFHPIVGIIYGSKNIRCVLPYDIRLEDVPDDSPLLKWFEAKGL